MFKAIFESIRQFGIFTGNELSMIESKLKPSTYKKNVFLLKEGEICQAFYFINQGSCRHFYINNNNEEIILNLYINNDWLSDFASFGSQKPSRNNIQAFEECEVLELSIHSIHELIQSSPSFFRIAKLFELVQRHDYSTNTNTPLENYKLLLANRPGIVRKFPLKYLASYLRITPETLSRVRRQIIS